jgi:non-lysosomal glucosylceramidase
MERRPGFQRHTRRGFALVAVAAVLCAGLPAVQASAENSRSTPGASGRDFFRYPAAAMVRDLGRIAPGVCPSDVAQICQGAPPSPLDPLKGNAPMTVPGLGIPLGGVGAGSFMVNQAGTFGPWFFGGSQDDSWEMRALPQAAFHVREQVGSAPATLRTLATNGPQVTGTIGPVPQRSWESPLPAWNGLKPGEGTYAALYPFGWTSYTPFKTDVSMRFFSPIVAGEDRRTSLPVAYFDVRLANHTGKSSDVSVMFTMPNAPEHVGRAPATVRTGLSSRFKVDHHTGAQAVTLSADSASNTPDAAHSQWTIAAKPGRGQKVTYTTSWNANGDGADVYAPFKKSGRLDDAPIDRSASAGAIAVSAKLHPGEVTTVPFALSWDFPQVTFANNNTVWMRRYTDFYGARETPQNNYVAGSYPFHQAFHIADDALAGHDAAVRAVESWWRPIATGAKYPLVLRTAALNQLAQVPFKTSLWEGGLVSNAVPPTLGKRLGTVVPGTHLYLGVDSPAGGAANGGMGTEVGTYSYLAYSQVFPTIERDRLRAKTEAILLDPYGDPYPEPAVTSSVNPADYLNGGDPYVTQTKSEPSAPGTVWFVDKPGEVIYRLYDYAQRHHDPGFLRMAYPAMRKLLAYVQATVPAGSHLPEPPSMLSPSPDLKSPLPFANMFDIIPVNRVDAYDSQLYLLGLETIIATAQRLRENATTVAAWKGQLSQAKAEYESVFWDPVHKYYRYTPGPTATNDSVLLATFFAQHLAERADLPDLVDPQRYRTQLKTQYPLFVVRRDAQGRLLGAPNMALPPDVPTFPYIGFAGPRQEQEVWPSVNYFIGATYYDAGQRFSDRDLRRQGIKLGSAVSTQIWQVEENGFQFDAPIAWNQSRTDHYDYPAFESNLAVWELINAIKPVRIHTPQRSGAAALSR